jgi:hypothetical protein
MLGTAALGEAGGEPPAEGPQDAEAMGEGDTGSEAIGDGALCALALTVDRATSAIEMMRERLRCMGGGPPAGVMHPMIAAGALPACAAGDAEPHDRMTDGPLPQRRDVVSTGPAVDGHPACLGVVVAPYAAGGERATGAAV